MCNSLGNNWLSVCNSFVLAPRLVSLVGKVPVYRAGGSGSIPGRTNTRGLKIFEKVLNWWLIWCHILPQTWPRSFYLPSHDFTWEISKPSPLFSISITANYFGTNSHPYLLCSSSCSKHTLNSIPFSQPLRPQFFNKCIEMRSSFLKRQYSVGIVDRAMHKAFSIDRTTALTSKTRAANDRSRFVNHNNSPHQQLYWTHF